MTTPGVIKRVSELFKGHNHLILEFNRFLPAGFKMTLPMVEQQQKERDMQQPQQLLQKKQQQLLAQKQQLPLLCQEGSFVVTKGPDSACVLQLAHADIECATAAVGVPIMSLPRESTAGKCTTLWYFEVSIVKLMGAGISLGFAPSDPSFLSDGVVGQGSSFGVNVSTKQAQEQENKGALEGSCAHVVEGDVISVCVYADARVARFYKNGIPMKTSGPE
jgi:histone deacetylase complex regulatory component SIN3